VTIQVNKAITLIRRFPPGVLLDRTSVTAQLPPIWRKRANPLYPYTDD
jgi:hypothetical protein